MTWPINLTQPPKVAAIATNIHGVQPFERFLLPDLWSLHLYRYSGQLIVQGQSLPIRPGHAGVVPPGVLNEYRYEGLSAHLYVHFRLPLEMDHQPHLIPAMQDLGDRFQSTFTRLSEVIDCPYSAQIDARVWDLLWELVAPAMAHTEPKSGHMSVDLVARLIEERLSQPLRVSDLAKEADVTPSYLTHLFRQVHGESVLGHIQKKRLDRALHLLRNSTLPIKSIAVSVGYPDLQHFNKVIRSATGRSPRNMRQSSNLAT